MGIGREWKLLLLLSWLVPFLRPCVLAHAGRERMKGEDGNGNERRKDERGEFEFEHSRVSTHFSRHKLSLRLPDPEHTLFSLSQFK
jgi:hypothetical protein